MPNHQKATELLELSGALTHNPHRRRPIGPKSAQPTGRAPSYMTPEEQAVWRELVANSPATVLTITDRPVLEVVTCLLAKFRANTELLSPPLLAQLASNLARLGWTPADRSRVIAAKVDERDN